MPTSEGATGGRSCRPRGLAVGAAPSTTASELDEGGSLPLHALVEKARPIATIRAVRDANDHAVLQPNAEGHLPIQIAVQKKLPRDWVDLVLHAGGRVRLDLAVSAITSATGQGSYAYEMAE